MAQCLLFLCLFTVLLIGITGCDDLSHTDLGRHLTSICTCLYAHLRANNWLAESYLRLVALWVFSMGFEEISTKNETSSAFSASGMPESLYQQLLLYPCVVLLVSPCTVWCCLCAAWGQAVKLWVQSCCPVLAGVPSPRISTAAAGESWSAYGVHTGPCGHSSNVWNRWQVTFRSSSISLKRSLCSLLVCVSYLCVNITWVEQN